jgi:hypothetical protein
VSHLYQVGRPYIPGRAGFPEGVEYNFRAGEHELLFFFYSPSRAEVKALRTGECEFALAVEGPVIFLLYRFGTAINWSDAPYSWHLIPPDQCTLPEAQGPDTRALLQIIVVDAVSGLLLALRVVTFSPTFTGALYAAIRAQAENSWVGQAAYDAALADLYRRYPTSADLLKRAVGRTQGGE